MMRAPAPDVPIVRVGILALLLVVFGLALLYAYRSQTPSIPQVDVSQAILDINAGRIGAIDITASRATLEFRDSPGRREQTTIPEPDTVMAPAVSTYNGANPSQRIDLRYIDNGPGLIAVGPIVLSVVVVLLLGGLVYSLMMRSRRRL